MFTLFWMALWAAFMVLAFVAGLSVRTRTRERIRRPGPHVDDEAVRRILETGSLVTDEDEALDLEEIAEEERRFWSESWDDPDE